MQVYIVGKVAIAKDDFGRVAKIEGYLFRRLLSQLAEQMSKTKKTERRILREIVASWPTEALNWVEVEIANK